MTNVSEMPVVWFTNYTSPDGFEESITLRGESLEYVYEERKKIIDRLKKIGATPVKRSSGSFSKKEVQYAKNANGEPRMCPMCGGRVIINTNPKGPEFKCENQKYDFATKSVTGCKYADWGKNSISVKASDHFNNQ